MLMKIEIIEGFYENKTYVNKRHANSKIFEPFSPSAITQTWVVGGGAPFCGTERIKAYLC